MSYTSAGQLREGLQVGPLPYLTVEKVFIKYVTSKNFYLCIRLV